MVFEVGIPAPRRRGSLKSPRLAKERNGKRQTENRKMEKVKWGEMRGGGLEPEASVEMIDVFSGECCTVLRRVAKVGPLGAKVARDHRAAPWRLADRACRSLR